MSQNIKNIISNTKTISMTDSALVTLMSFERVLDELDLYVFKNWKLGELVMGPKYEKYFITCTFMWPNKLMPDPSGGKRLLDYDCEVYYKKDHLVCPIKIKDPDDFEPGTKMPKMKRLPIWLVTIVMPKILIQEIKQGSVEIEGENIEIEDIDQAYEEGDADSTEIQSPEEMNAPGQ